MTIKYSIFIFYFLLLYLISCCEENKREKQCEKSFQILKEYNFEDTKYNLLIIRNEKSHITKTIAGVLFSNKNKTLKKFQDAWNLCENQEIHRCGYGFDIYIYYNLTRIEKMQLNIRCKDLLTEKGKFIFDINETLFPFMQNAVPIYRYNLCFNSDKERLNFSNKIDKKQLIIQDSYLSNSNILQYDYLYQFKYTVSRKPKIQNYNNKVKEILREYFFDSGQFYLEQNRAASFFDKDTDSICLTFNLFCDSILDFSLIENFKISNEYKPIELNLFSLENISLDELDPHFETFEKVKPNI